MPLLPVILYRCSDCNRLYEEKPENCICERRVYVEGERIGPFVVKGNSEKQAHVKVRCILCDTFVDIAYSNIRRQQSCGCKPRSAEVLELSEEVLVYRCRRCGKSNTAVLPIITYCCEEGE